MKKKIAGAIISALFIISLLLLFSSCKKVKNSYREYSVLTPSQHSSLIHLFAPTEPYIYSEEYYAKTVSAFMKEHENIEVVFDGLPWESGYDFYLEERLKNGLADDIFAINENDVKELASAGFLYDLKDLEIFKNLPETSKEQALYKDIAYCMPLYFSTNLLIANKRVLDQFGIQMPKNLTEFKNACEILKSNGITPISLDRNFSISVPALSLGMKEIYSSQDKDNILLSLNNGTTPISTYMEKGFEIVEHFIQSGWYGDNLTSEKVSSLRSMSNDSRALANGETAFLFGNLAHLEQLKAIKPDGIFIICGIPTDDDPVILSAPYLKMAINAKSKNIEAAIELLEYFAENIPSDNKSIEEFQRFGTPNYKPSREMKPLYDTYLEGTIIPIEDALSDFSYWDVVQNLCLKLFDGMSAKEVSLLYDEYQMAMVLGEKIESK